MKLADLQNRFGEFAQDIKTNLEKFLYGGGAVDLNHIQVWGSALAASYATRNKPLIEIMENEVADKLLESEIKTAKAAASIMAMNNAYYRFLEYVRHDEEYKNLSVGLRMSVMSNPQFNKLNFRAYCLAVSVINGCGYCVRAHVREVQDEGMSKVGVQSIVRIASIINAVAQVMQISESV